MKNGLDFFSFDVDFFYDEKIQFISARFGAKGELCIIKLLTKIYRQGYFTKWDEDTACLFAKVAGAEYTDGFVNDVVYELVKRGFFEESIFNSFGILTSRGIQARYFKACERRKTVEADERFLLIDTTDFKNLKIRKACSSTPNLEKCKHDVNISDKNVNISNQNADISKQSKVKESKVKKKRNIKEIVDLVPYINNYTENIELRKALNEYVFYRKDIKNELTLKALKIAFNSLSKGNSIDEKIAMINKTIFCHWIGIFPLRSKDEVKVYYANGNNNETEAKPKYGKIL